MKFETVREIFKRTGKQGHVVFEADFFAGCDEVFFADVAEVGIVEDQITEFRALLNEVDGTEAFDLVVKAVETDELAEDDARVIEAQRLVKIAG
jgi:hypothetical protein